MTIKERIAQAARGESEIDHLIFAVFEMGKEAAAREICDEHNRRVALMRQAANTHPYRHLCNSIIDAGQGEPYGDIIYTPHYAGDMTDTFGNDEWTLD